MSIEPLTLTAGAGSARRASGYWSVLQAAALLAAVALVALLFLRPTLGLTMLWNVLIPVAPVLIVIAPGLWRNVCPMATVSLPPRELGRWRRRIITARGAGFLYLTSAGMLCVIVMLRHACFDTEGPYSAAILLGASAIAFAMGLRYEGRSGWCTSLCPIHSVEKLYGRAPAVTITNARCATCRRCTVPCPDSTPDMEATRSRSRLGQGVGTVMTGGFAGFIWGWFQVADVSGRLTLAELGRCFAWPLAGAAVSLSAYFILRRGIARSERARRTLDDVFATAAVSTYYWFRLPVLLGFGEFHDTALYDLSGALPVWTPLALHALSIAFFGWFLLIRPAQSRPWMFRPPTATLESLATSR